MDETYVKVAGRWVYLYRAIDQDGQVIDVLVSQNRDLATTHRFFTRALEHGPHPTEGDHRSGSRVSAGDRGVDTCRMPRHRAARESRVVSTGHAFVQNLRRSHYELGVDIDRRHRLTAIFTELARAI